jgi:hypothetical protein
VVIERGKGDVVDGLELSKGRARSTRSRGESRAMDRKEIADRGCEVREKPWARVIRRLQRMVNNTGPRMAGGEILIVNVSEVVSAQRRGGPSPGGPKISELIANNTRV